MGLRNQPGRLKEPGPGRFPEDVVMLLASTNLVAGKARNYAWASVASGSRLPVLAGGAVGADATKAAAALKDELRAPLDASFFTVNGELRPTFRPPAGAWLRWRVVNGGSNDILSLELSDATACEASVVAREATPGRGSNRFSRRSRRPSTPFSRGLRSGGSPG